MSGTVFEVDDREDRDDVTAHPAAQRHVSRTSVSRTFAAFVAVVAALLGLMLAQESSYGRSAPGPVYVLSDTVSGVGVVDDGLGGSERGSTAFTTVEIHQLRYVEVWWRTIRGERLIPLTELSSQGPATQMAASKDAAAAAALVALGADRVPTRVVVTDVAPASPASRAGVQPGDVLVSVSELSVSDASSAVEVLAMHPGPVSATFERDGERSGMLLERDATEPVGLLITTMLPAALHDTFTADTAAVGGASAGLMLALTFVDAGGAGDLTAGLRLAGTGTIEPSGHVGQVVGVPEKVFAAERDGFEVFFVPSSLVDDVPSTSLEIVPVDTLGDAIDWLCARGADDVVCDTR